MDKFCKYLSKLLRNHCMAIYRDTGVFCLSITGTENFQYRPLLFYNNFVHIISLGQKVTLSKMF